MDRSQHLLVLACPEAAASRGMEIEASHWFSRERDGEIIVIVTAGATITWDEMRRTLLPPPFRDRLHEQPLWVPLVGLRDKIHSNPNDRRLRENLVDELKQVFLCLYPNHNWEQLRGEERQQRRRALTLISSVALVTIILFVAALIFALYAREQQHKARSLQLASQATQTPSHPMDGLRLAIEANRIEPTDDSLAALNHVLEPPQVRLVLHHQGRVNNVNVSPDGLKIATASDDGFTRIWDAQSGAMLLKVSSLPGTRVVFSPDGKRIVTGEFEVWSVADGKRVFPAGVAGETAPASGGPQRSNVTAIDYAPDGSRVLTADHDGYATLWDAMTGASIAHFEVCGDFDAYGSFSPDSHLLVTYGVGCVVAEVRDAISGKVISQLGHYDPKEAESYQGHGRPRGVVGAVFSNDSTRIAFLMWHDKSEVYEARTGRVLHAFDHLTSDLTAADFSPDDKWLVTATSDFRLIVWDVNSFDARETLVGHTAGITSVDFNDDGTRIISTGADNTVRIWDPRASGTLLSPLVTLGGDPEAGMQVDATVAPDFSWVAIGRDDGTVWVWDTQATHPRLRLSNGVGPTENAAFSPDDHLIAGLDHEHAGTLWKFPSGDVAIHLCCDEERSADQLFFSNDGKLLITRLRYARFVVWDVASGTKLSTLPAHRYEGGVQAFSADSRRFAIVNEDYKTATVWDTISGKKVAQFGNDSRIHSLEFLPNGSEIVALGDDHTVRLYGASTGQVESQFSLASDIENAILVHGGTQILTIDDTPAGEVRDLRSHRVLLTLDKLQRTSHAQVSADGSRLTVVSRENVESTLQLFDLRSGRLIATIDPGTRSYVVKDSVFSPDSKHLLTIGDDRIVRVFDTSTGTLRQSLRGHTDAVNIAVFSPDSALIVTGAQDGTVRVWRVQTGQALAVYRVGSYIQHVSFSSDSHQIAVAMYGSGVLVYSLDTKDLMECAGRLIPNEVGPAETRGKR